jgi:hypothetical protein
MARLHTKSPPPPTAVDKLIDGLAVVEVVSDEVLRERLASRPWAEQEFRREVPPGMASQWALVRCPIGVFEVPGVIDRERMASYATLATAPPPVVAFRSSQGAQHLTIFDGCHRVTAARLRDDATILAYVPEWQLRR